MPGQQCDSARWVTITPHKALQQAISIFPWSNYIPKTRAVVYTCATDVAYRSLMEAAICAAPSTCCIEFLACVSVRV